MKCPHCAKDISLKALLTYIEENGKVLAAVKSLVARKNAEGGPGRRMTSEQARAAAQARWGKKKQ